MKTMKMKTKTNMNTSLIFSLFVLCSLFSVLLSCEQPFVAGLGPLVDTRPPSVKLENPGPGTFIWGNKVFSGTADDDYKLETVEMRVTDKPGISLFSEYTPVNLTLSKQNKGTWEISMDTKVFGEGPIKIRLRATDAAQKVTETDEILFTIKNEPPEVNLQSPFIRSANKTGSIGTKPLNWNMGNGTVTLDAYLGKVTISDPDDPDYPERPGFTRKLEKGVPVSGTILFEQDIYTGSPSGNMYPPQIRIWPLDSTGDNVTRFKPGIWPSLEQVPWQNLLLEQTGIGRYSFNHLLDDADVGQFYGFEIRVISKIGHADFRYPRDFYPSNLTPEEEAEYRYVIFYIKTQTSFPDVGLYENREDLSSSTYPYPSLPPVNEDDRFDRGIISSSDEKRNGPFTLRYFAQHPDNIFSAEIYWEKEGTNERGRFIWDSAGVTTPLPTPYTLWGTDIPSVMGVDPGKNFVFTYTHPSDSEPNNTEPGYTSKVQQYTGNLDWTEAKLDGRLASEPNARWTSLKRLTEGVYKLEVIARYPSYSAGKINWTPYRNTIRLDLTPPEARINDIKGMVETVFSGIEATVNGVVEPEATFSDWRNTDNPYYGTDTPEQRWLLVSKDSKTAMDNLINAEKARGGYWPPVPANPSTALTIPGVTVLKHGPLADSKFRFKTSGIYNSGETVGTGPTNTLEDGDYWLYVAVRDEAYNVGYATPVEIKVRADTDMPTIVALGEINDLVETADLVWSATTPDPTGFETGVLSFRNRLSPNATIRLRLFDDDGLNLAGVKVTIAKAAAANAAGGGITAPAGAEISGVFTGTGSPRTSDPGTITQTAMATALGLSGVANLPDGIYLLQITAPDDNDPNIKLKMPGDSNNAAVKTATINIWLFVDTTAPVITIVDNNNKVPDDDPAPDVWIDPTNGLDGLTPPYTAGGGLHGVRFSGTITDANGPVTVKSFTIVNDRTGAADTGWANRVFVRPTDVTITRGASTTEWNATFTAPVHIDPDISHPTSGYRVTLTVVDRFGREKSIVQKYQVDKEPPTATLQTPIETFERIDAVRLAGIDLEDQKQLVNGVVYFNISASDNRKLSEVRWWLLPVGTSFMGWAQDEYGTGNTTVPDLDDKGYTSIHGTVNGKKYYYTRMTKNWSQRFYVDTKEALSDNTRYNLYIMALDSANLQSVGPHDKQPFFVRQQEDAPYFERQGGGDGSLTVVDKTEMIISLTITDDDGFFDENGRLRAGTLKIYLDDASTHGPSDVGTFNPSSGTWSPADLTSSYGAALTLVHNQQGARIVSQGKKQVTLTLDLNSSDHTYFLSKLGDGPKHYIIEAEDSWFGKYTVKQPTPPTPPIAVGEGTAATDIPANKKTWRQYYTMILDSNPPTIEISTPASSTDPASLFIGGKTTTGFTVNGFIDDSYLKVTNDDNYYFKLKLDSADLAFADIPEFKLGTGASNGHITTVSGTRVNFSIPSAAFTTAIDYGNLTHGRHSLTFIAEDKSGKTGSASINFVRDTRPPEWRFASGFNDNKTEMPKIGTRDWWVATTNPADYLTKRAIDTLPVVSYDASSGDVPSLSGTFSDDFSKITSFKVTFDGVTEIIVPIAPAEQDTNFTWEIFLTDDGTATGTPLKDGVHTIQLSVSDAVGNETESIDYAKMYGFRLISQTPESTLTPPAQTVYGDRTGAAANTAVFTVTGAAKGYNLALTNPVQLIVRYADTISGHTFTAQNIPTTGAFTFSDSAGPPAAPNREDVLETYTWSHIVPRSVILAAGRATVGGTQEPALTKMRAGTYEVVAIASDRSATPKKSEETTANVWQFTVDTEGPKFSFPMDYDDYLNPVVGDTKSNLPTYYLTTPGINGRNVIQDAENPQVRGSVTDGNKLADVELQISKWNYTVANQTTATTNAWQIYNTSTNAWVNWSAANAALANYWIPLNTASIDAASYAVNWEFDQIATLEDGYYRVRLRARDTTTSPGGTPGWTTDNNGNPAYSPFVFFFLDRSPPDVEVVETDTGYYSTGNAHNFSADIIDRNMIDTVRVSVSDDTGTELANPAPVIRDNLRPNATVPATTPVRATVPLTFPASLPDGSYKVIFTVTDFAGRTTTKNRTIRLDNTPPTVTITEPREATRGSETFQITGSTNDTGPSGSASGVQAGNATSGLWYHIGYGSRTALPDLTGLTGTARSNEIKTWVLGDGYTAITVDNGAANNGLFDTASGSANSLSLWFKYVETTTNFIVPPGFDPITATEASDLLTWVLHAGNTVVNNYSILTQTIRGQSYTASSTRRLARADSADPSGKSSHSLPLVVRVVDNAGNAAYELYDIRLDPNGDNPKSVINNPSENLDKDAARGGQMQVNGIATDNIGVRRVIYRVKVGNGNDTRGSVPTGAASIISLSGSPVNFNDFNTVLSGKTLTQPVGTGALTERGDGWYDAVLGAPGSATSDWSFMLNQSGEISDAINGSRGFASITGGPKDMIRVWIEVLVFDQKDDGSYNLVSLGSSSDPNTPRPYYREFYFTSSAPEITDRQISELGSTTTFVPYTSPLAQNYIRSGQFVVKAKLDAKKAISQIRVRLPDDTLNTDWTTVYSNDPSASVTTLDGLSFPLNAGSTAADLTWQFDSVANGLGSYQVRLGTGTSWSASGGTYKVEVSVRDTGDPQAEASYSFEIGIDNFAPLADTVRNITPTKVAGTDVIFQGRVFDYSQTAGTAPTPPHQKAAKIYAWFSNRSGTHYLKLDDGTLTAKGTLDTQRPVRTGRNSTITWNETGSATSIAVTDPGTLNTFSYPAITHTDYVKVMDDTALPSSGITWSPNNNDQSDVSWMLRLDTTKWPDGWVKLHYIVIDHADNASYYTQDMIVMNRVPQISKITLYTDNTGEGAVFTDYEGDEASLDIDIPTTPYASGYLNSGFVSKNDLIGFGVNTVLPGGGNPPIKFEARYVQRYRMALTNANLRAMLNKTGNLTCIADGSGGATVAANAVNNLYTIASTNGLSLPGWQKLGVQRSTPVDGTHFVFLPDDEMRAAITTAVVADQAHYPNAFVYIYRQPTGMPALTATKNAANISNDDRAVVLPSEMYFSGSDHFGGNNKINEAQANNATNAYYSATDVETASQGTAFFLIKVWDTVNRNIDDGKGNATATDVTMDPEEMLYDAIVIGMKVFQGDRRRPFARLYDLNPYMEPEVSGSNIGNPARAETLKNAADPIEAGVNVLRGGLYNVGTVKEPIKSGYIDPRSGSTALYPYVNIPSDFTDPYLHSTQAEPDWLVSGDSAATGPARDKVSGSIILRGLAWDDQLVDEVRIKIGSDPEKLLLKLRWWSGVTNDVWSVTETPTPMQVTTNKLVRKMVAVTPDNTWVAENIHWQSGHTVEWAYLWNTAREPSGRTTGASPNTDYHGGPLPNQTVTVTVWDKNGTRQDNEIVPVANETAPTKFHNQVTVDIVPYLTGIVRDSIYATTRSRQGWYSFYQGETGIRLLGYNLGNNPANATGATNIFLNTANAEEGTTVNGYTYVEGATTIITRKYERTSGRAAELPNDGHIFAIPSGAVSSRINVAVGANATETNRVWNHSSDHRKSWNAEKSDTASGSDLWTNRPYAHIWRTTQDPGGGTPTTPPTYFGNNSSNGGSWDAESPSMALEFGTTDGTSGETTGDGAQVGRLHGVWSHRSSFKTFYAANDTGAAIRLQEAQDPQAYTDVAYYPGTDNGNNITAVYVYQWDALPNILLRTHMRYLEDGSGRDTLGKNPGGTIMPYLVMRDNRSYPTDTLRWQNIRTSMAAVNVNTGSDPGYYPHEEPDTTPNTSAARGNSGRVFTTGYDAVGKNVIFIERNGFINSPATDTPNRSGLPLFIDGGNAASGVTNSDVAGTITAAARVGNWAAVGYVSNGGTNNATTVPVIAYYDETNDTLRLAYGSSGSSNGAGNNWTRRYVLPSSNALFRGSGKYVSLKVDRSNNIHLAFYNSTYNVMVYAVGTRTGAFTAQIVDNVIKGGEWTDIAVDSDGNPWITYGDMGRSGNYDGVRIAYKTTGTGTSFPRALTDAVSSQIITGWEAVTMPANYTIANDRLNIEAWPPTNRPGQTAAITGTGGGWNAAIGYVGAGGTTKQFRIGYFFKPATVLMTALTD